MILGSIRGASHGAPVSLTTETGLRLSPRTREVCVRLSDLALPTGLTVVLSDEVESEWRAATAAACAASGGRWIALVLDAELGVRLGPLSRRDWPVCTECADARIEAARSAPARPAEPAKLGRLAQIAAALLARELDSLVPDTESHDLLARHVLRVDPSATSLTLHRVVGMPGCRCCAGPGTAQDRPLMLGNLTEVLTQLDGWLDPVTGVIPTVRLDHPLGEAPDLPTVATAAGPRIVSGRATKELPVGWGKGLGDGAALVSAVGEAVERYSASLPDEARISWSDVAGLPGDVLSPAEFPLYTAEQYDGPGFAYARCDPRQVHPWVRGHWYGSDEPVWVPAVLTYLQLQLQPHQHIVQGSSNGLAAGWSVADAADRAVLELIERDAFLTAWRTGHALVPVDVDSVDPALQPTLRGLRRLGLTVELAYASSQVGVPTLIAMARGDGVRTPGACMGMAASPDPSQAAGSAILELAQTVPHLTELMRSGQLPIPRAESEVTSMLDHAAYFFPPERAHWFDRLYQPGARPVDLAELPSVDPAGVARQLRSHGVRLAVVDVTAPDVASGPFRVARAVSPDLMPITFGHGFHRLPPARVEQLPVAAPTPPLHPVW